MGVSASASVRVSVCVSVSVSVVKCAFFRHSCARACTHCLRMHALLSSRLKWRRFFLRVKSVGVCRLLEFSFT